MKRTKNSLLISLVTLFLYQSGLMAQTIELVPVVSKSISRTVDPPKQTDTIVMKGGGYWMCFSPDGKFCYISERIGDSVAVIDTATKKTIARIAVGRAPKRVLVVTVREEAKK